MSLSSGGSLEKTVKLTKGATSDEGLDAGYVGGVSIAMVVCEVSGGLMTAGCLMKKQDGFVLIWCG